ncbi:protein PHLOEM PROTEIN 2-LIKE A10-like [Prosopis cineraria]|uniref:protein PHLOEM PROTEIN 2-LIKE A10-like n=1 Tax=Prosopis cineraria TaxID=364024 RepID=UPI002410460F|nr:protein PHLOEM PROTEIN 2-LIKE A10-like [Prosopis cineraria]
MELQLVEKGFDYARKRKKWLFLLAAVGFTGYGAFKIYHLPSVTRKRKRLLKLLGALISVSEAVSESAEAVGLVSRDMKEFLQSNSDQLPNSLKQISKITRSREFSDSLINVTQSLTLGVLKSYQSLNNADHNQTSDSSSLVDRLVDKLFAPAGSGFVSVVVGSFARNLVLGFYSNGNPSGESNSSSSNTVSVRHLSSSNMESESMPGWMDAVCCDQCRDLIGNCVQLFVSTAVTVYLDKTMHINTYDDFFSGLTNPKHESKVRDMVVSVCNNAIETLVKTSHQVLTSSDPNVNSSSTTSLPIEEGSSPARNENLDEESSSDELKAEVSEEEKESGWMGKVSSTLAVPSNRRLILDVTGKVTFETVRSFMEFVLEMFCACVKRFADVVHETIVEIVRYVAAKSAVIITICLSLCLHIMGGAWALVPA